MSLQLLHDLQKNVTFFQFVKKILDVASLIVFPAALDVDDVGNIAKEPDSMFSILKIILRLCYNNWNTLEKDNSGPSKQNTSQLKVGSFPSVTNQQYNDKTTLAEETKNQPSALPDWMVQGAFVFFILGL